MAGGIVDIDCDYPVFKAKIVFECALVDGPELLNGEVAVVDVPCCAIFLTVRDFPRIWPLLS